MRTSQRGHHRRLQLTISLNLLIVSMFIETSENVICTNLNLKNKETVCLNDKQILNKTNALLLYMVFFFTARVQADLPVPPSKHIRIIVLLISSWVLPSYSHRFIMFYLVWQSLFHIRGPHLVDTTIQHTRCAVAGFSHCFNLSQREIIFSTLFSLVSLEQLLFIPIPTLLGYDGQGILIFVYFICTVQFLLRFLHFFFLLQVMNSWEGEGRYFKDDEAGGRGISPIGVNTVAKRTGGILQAYGSQLS